MLTRSPMTTTNKLNPWDLDIRVRERNLKNGTLNDKDIDKMVVTLPDLAEQTEPVTTGQPAVEGDDEDDDEEG